MSDISSLSISPGVRVDPRTGEILEELEPNNSQVGIMRPGSYNPPIYSQQSIDTARETTSILCEKVLSRITRGRRVKKGNNRGHDILLPTGEKLEAKVGRIGNGAVVKENQLFEFDANYWGFLFYSTSNNFPPSYYTSQDKNISPSEYLLRNIRLKVAFIFPSAAMKYYWNTVPVKKGVISTTGIAHRPFAHSRAMELLGNENIPGTGFKKEIQYGRHNFPVYSIDFEL